MATTFGVDMRFGSALHTTVSSILKDRLLLSHMKMRGRHAQMAINEEQFKAYLPARDADIQRTDIRKNTGLPQYTTIEIPYSYATLLTAHTYYTSVFLSRSPVLQIQGRHGEAEMQVQALESLLDYQIGTGGAMVPLFTWLLDPGKYGYGVVGMYWDEEIIRVRQIQEEQPSFLGVPIPGMSSRKVHKVLDVPGYTGNRVYNVRPQDWFADPRVPMWKFQEGEFCARYVEIAWNTLVEGGKAGEYFNVDILKQQHDSTDGAFAMGDILRDTGSSRVTTLPNDWTSLEGTRMPNGFVRCYEMFIKIIPTQWKVATGNKQEIWVFTITTSGTIIRARPLGEFHGKFPFGVMEIEPDGYSQFTRSTLETIKPLNDAMTWLMNSHFYNVRNNLNNMFVVDPAMVVMKDVTNPNPGKVIRLKAEAMGRDVRAAITQLQTTDVTRNHMNDMSVLEELIQRTTGVTDNVMGMLATTGRKTATEIRTTTSFGVNRLKTQCEYFSAMGFTPFTQMLIQSSQQHYERDLKLRIVGSAAQFGPQFVDVNPESIAGFFDYIPVDGTLPVDRFAQANMWQGLLQTIASVPQIGMTYDIAKIFGYVAQLGGISNLSQFKVSVVPDGQLQQQAQMGNSVPLAPEGAGGGLPPQVPGVGPTG